MKSLRILLLEDDPDHVELLRLTLLAEWPDCELICVERESHFQEALQRGGLDLVLADYYLPAFGGLQALQMTRGFYPQLPFIFVSGAIGDEVAVDCLKGGATDYVLKDKLVKLVPAVRRALKEAEERELHERAEEQLRQREKQFEELLNAVDGIVWQADFPDLRFTFVSQQAERFLGYPVQRWLEEPRFWENHIHPEDRDRAIALCTQLTAQRKYRSFEYRMIAADGRIVWLRDLVSVRDEHGQPQQLQGIMVNITPSKLAESARQESEAVRSVIMEAQLDCIMILDSEGRFVEFSPSAEKTLGFSKVEVIGESLVDTILSPELRAEYAEAIGSYPAKSDFLRNRHEVMAVRAAGWEFPAELAIVPLQLGEHHVFVAYLRDITERKQSENRMRRAQVKLREMNLDLTRRNREIQSFYHTLSHELKTPLTAAREFICIVKDGLGGPVNPTQLDYLETAKQSCDQLTACINDLLDATRLDTGKLSLDRKPADLGELVRRVAATFGPQAANKDIRLVQEIQPDLPLVPLDEHRLTQVVGNLVNNAIKYTPPGGRVLIKAGADPQRPELVRVSVTDTGCGISKEEQDRIFDRLYQVKSGDATTDGGVGLGLYLCRELVELHGGRIWVESEPGNGSNFSFVLPTNQQALQANLLIIGDDPDALKNLQQSLSSEPYNVKTLRDGPEALDELQRRTPDVIILDLATPNVNGPSNLKEIRKRCGEVPIILHTDHSDFDWMREALQFSPFTLLAKPSSVDEIVRTLREVQRSGDTAHWEKTPRRKSFKARSGQQLQDSIYAKHK